MMKFRVEAEPGSNSLDAGTKLGPPCLRLSSSLTAEWNNLTGNVMQNVNLTHLSKPGQNRISALKGLNELANSSEGPLRVTVRNGVPSVGVRSWCTFFFETFACVDTDIRRIEKETVSYIQQYVDPLMDHSQSHVRMNKEKSPESPALAVSVASLSLRLRAKVAGRNLQNRLGNIAWMKASATEPAYQNVAVKHATARSFDGMVAVPKGLSAGKIPIMNVMADHRLAADVCKADNPAYHPKIPTTIQAGVKNTSHLPDEQMYFVHYMHNLNQLPDFRSGSIAVELGIGHDTTLAPGQFEGAWRAANKFIEYKKMQGLPVSVLLCMDCALPRVNGERDRSTAPGADAASFEEDKSEPYV